MFMAAERYNSRQPQKGGRNYARMPLGHRTSTEQLTVADRMTAAISVVSPETRLAEAAYLITTMHVVGLAVYEGNRYVGFIGHQLLRDALRAPEPRLNQARVAGLMNRAIRPCSPDEPIREVWSRMRQLGQADLPVIDENGRVAGILSMGERRIGLASFCSITIR